MSIWKMHFEIYTYLFLHFICCYFHDYQLCKKKHISKHVFLISLQIKTTTETRPPSSIFSTMQTSTLISPMSSSVSQSIDSENLKNDAADEDKLVPQSTTKTFTSTSEDLQQKMNQHPTTTEKMTTSQDKSPTPLGG